MRSGPRDLRESWATAGLAAAVAITAIVLLSAAAPAMHSGPGGAAPAPALAAIKPHDVLIPAFSRMYGTACSTCHTAAPKLNVFGEVFRLNGYRMPPSELMVRKDDPVSLGAPEWDELWPRSIRSSDLPGIVPLALRIVSDARLTRDERVPYDATYRFPEQIELLAGAPLGDAVSTFLNVGWSPDGGLDIHQAKVVLQDPVPGLPSRMLNLGIGLQDPYLLTFGHQHIDRAARQPFLWQTFEASEVEVHKNGGDEPFRTDNRLVLGNSQPALEVNGLIGRRLHFGVGLSQGLGDGATDRNGRKDLYYKVRYKFGGLNLRGAYDSEQAPDQALAGQLLDRTLVIEHFGYLGSESTENARQGEHTAFGLAARALLGRLDLGAGYVIRSFARPWPELSTGHLEAESLFARTEYLALPWIIGSLKAEWVEVLASDLPPGVSVAPSPTESTRVLPGVVLLLRQNVRLALEGEFFLRHPETRQAGLNLPHNLWMRLDVAF